MSYLKTGASVAIVSLGLAACGSSSKSSSSTGGSSGSSSSGGLSRADLIKQVDAICATAQAAIKKVPAPSNVADVNQAASYFDKAAAIADAETRQMAALKPDSSLGSDWTAFLSEQRAGTALLETIKQKADAADRSGLQDLRKLPAEAAKANAAATKLGAKTCAG
jgi:hypothetical protein